MKLTLRAKAILAFVAMAAYVAAVGFMLASERQKLLDLAIGLEQTWMHDRELGKTEYAIHNAIIRIQANLYSSSPVASLTDDVALDVELVQSGLQQLQKHFPEFDEEILRLSAQIGELRAAQSRAALIGLQGTQSVLETRLRELGLRVAHERETQWTIYYRVYDRMTFIALTTVLLGAIVFGTMGTMFFSRLTWDLGKLGARAEGVIAGYRGAPLPVTRKDEVGDLMEAVNRMQIELRKHEQQLELVRQQRFHQEKMAAIGSLSAAVTHEINNPIAAIAGIARTMAESRKSANPAADDFESVGPTLILEQTERISLISRQIAEFARPHSPKPELTDLNRLVQGICRFTSYDKRLRSVEILQDLDEKLPAGNCVADHVTQVLMNLLINAGDAVANIPARKPQIEVITRREDDNAIVAVRDNGHGMDQDVMDHAFDEGFSTKASGQGLGLGLFLCKALVEGDGGKINLASELGTGTTVSFTVPLQPT